MSIVRDADREYLLTLRGVFPDAAELESYVADAWERIRVVLRLLHALPKGETRRVLELGANPYVMTALLRRDFAFDLELANYFGEGACGARHTQLAELGGEAVEFPFAHFNIETEVFPYQDGSFDCVLFCEILEHLLRSPDAAVAEMARVLRPGGHLILSTPNVTRLSNLYFLALGNNIYEGYSPNGPYGRHNREYTLPEIRELLDRHGFQITRAEVRNIRPLARRFTYLQWLRPTVWNDHHFVVGGKRP